MITDKTLDEALVEVMRTKRALETLRKFRKTGDRHCPNDSCKAAWEPVPFGMGEECVHCDTHMSLCLNPIAEHAAALRASMDLTRKLVDLRQGR